MPGSATHLAIADRICSLVGASAIQNTPLFFCGNIAPDAIHAKPGYQREDKRHTHLTKDMPTDSFHNAQMLKQFHGRVNTFIKDFYLTAKEDKDLYLGYVVHLLADELFNIAKRTPFNRLVFLDGINQTEQDLFNKILADIDGSDKLLVSRYPYTCDVVGILEAVWDYEIKGYVGKDELNSSKQYTIGKFKKAAAPQTISRYYSYDEAVEFVDYAASNIVERLSGASDIIAIL